MNQPIISAFQVIEGHGKEIVTFKCRPHEDSESALAVARTTARLLASDGVNVRVIPIVAIGPAEAYKPFSVFEEYKLASDFTEQRS